MPRVFFVIREFVLRHNHVPDQQTLRSSFVQKKEFSARDRIDELASIARAADRLGYHHLTCSEHVAISAESHSTMLGGGRGTRYWDPLATFGHLSAVTTSIRLVTSVLVLGYHHPLEIAKRYGTLDLVSGGRLVLGVGVGTATEEFDLLGVPFDDRGARADDALRALRASLSRRQPSYDGEFYRFDGLVVDPHALQDRVPLWVGGASSRALRRAVQLGDGWLPAAIEPDLLRERLARWPELPPGFDVSARPPEALDPVGAPERTKQLLKSMQSAGTTILEARFVHESLSHYLEQLEALVPLARETSGAPA